MRAMLPFPLRGLDSDNGAEFINLHLFRYCEARAIQFTRGRPYKKDDNAHIEQKNWTHVRRLLGWHRYDSPQALAAINDLYRHELRLMMNLFQVKKTARVPTVPQVRAALQYLLKTWSGYCIVCGQAVPSVVKDDSS